MASRCKAEGCGQPIAWAVTTNGVRMPLDADEKGAPLEVEGGNVQPTGRRVQGALEVSVLAPISTGGKYRAHFASCVAASEFKRTKASHRDPKR